jgi:hypothetical protein
MPEFEESTGYKMKYQGNNSAFPFKTNTPDFSDPKQQELYKNSPEYRAYLKSKGITYDSKTNKSTKKSTK